MGAAIAGGILAGISNAIGAEMQADAMQYNADMSQFEADYIRSKARVDEAEKRREGERNVASGQMVAGATGFTQGGTNADIIDQIRREGEMDAAMIRHAGEVGAWSKEQESMLAETQVDAIRHAGHFNAAASTMGGAGYSGGGSGQRSTIYDGGDGDAPTELSNPYASPNMGPYDWSRGRKK